MLDVLLCTRSSVMSWYIMDCCLQSISCRTLQSVIESHLATILTICLVYSLSVIRKDKARNFKLMHTKHFLYSRIHLYIELYVYRVEPKLSQKRWVVSCKNKYKKIRQEMRYNKFPPLLSRLYHNSIASYTERIELLK